MRLNVERTGNRLCDRDARGGRWMHRIGVGSRPASKGRTSNAAQVRSQEYLRAAVMKCGRFKEPSLGRGQRRASRLDEARRRSTGNRDVGPPRANRPPPRGEAKKLGGNAPEPGDSREGSPIGLLRARAEVRTGSLGTIGLDSTRGVVRATVTAPDGKTPGRTTLGLRWRVSAAPHSCPRPRGRAVRGSAQVRIQGQDLATRLSGRPGRSEPDGEQRALAEHRPYLAKITKGRTQEATMGSDSVTSSTTRTRTRPTKSPSFKDSVERIQAMVDELTRERFSSSTTSASSGTNLGRWRRSADARPQPRTVRRSARGDRKAPKFR